MRIVILEANDQGGTPPDELALAVGGIAWRGCATKDPDVGYEHCFADSTVDAGDPVAYRHFAIDDDNLIAYFCDANPTLDRMLCYKCDLKEAPDVNCKGNQTKGSNELNENRKFEFLPIHIWCLNQKGQ